MNVSLPLESMITFEAVARHASFTRAAHELSVTQSAVSHRVSALESELALTLLVRSTRSVALTDDGEILADGIRQGVQAVRAALDTIASNKQAQTLSVSCSPSFAIRWLVRHLHEFRELHPQLSVRLAAEDQLVAPGSAGVHACVRFGAGRYPGFLVTRLTREQSFPVASPRLLEQCPLRAVRDLRRHVLIHHDVLVDHPGRIDWRRWLAGARQSREVDTDAGPRFSHAHMAIEAAMAGEGVALGRSSLVADDLAAGRLVAPLRRRRPSGLSYWFLTTPSGAEMAAVASFRDWLLERLTGEPARAC
jgi:LysR family transcriptional regulator, glycine cleavage system transcriptional activator